MPIGWNHSLAGIVRKAVMRSTDLRKMRVAVRIKRTYDLPPLPRRQRQQGEIWAIFMVKNEADVIEHSIRHAVAQGVDRILVVDNGSSDGTIELLRDLSRKLPLLVGFDRETAYYQSEKMTHLTRWAGRRGADWVVPMDADEFWYAQGDSLANAIRSSDCTILEAEMFNLFPTESVPHPEGLHKPLRFDHARHTLGKTAIKTHPLAWLSMGNHQGLRPGLTGGGLFVAHLPWRSEEQFVRKVQQGAEALQAATGLAENIGGHWRRQAEQSAVEAHEAWLNLLSGRGSDELGWSPRGPFSVVEAGSWQTWQAPTQAGSSNA